MKKKLSYLYPVRLKNYPSHINGPLEVNLVQGKKTLDTRLSNYSYGTLQEVLHKGLAAIKFNKDTRTVLVLGMGAGSIVETIRETFHSDAFIELVELDEQIIQIALDDFDIKRFDKINLVHADALDYVQNSSNTFDLIIVDLFIINEVPEPFTRTEFINNLCGMLSSGGKIIYNSIRDTMPRASAIRIKNTFSENGLSVQVLEKVCGYNELIIAGNMP